MPQHRWIQRFRKDGQYPEVTRFELEQISVGSDDLARFLKNHARTLKKLSFDHVALVDCEWHSFLTERVERISDFDATIRLKWLMNLGSSPAPIEEAVYIVLMDMDELRSCSCCDISRKMELPDCKHISKVLRSSSLRTLPHFEKMLHADFFNVRAAMVE